ncbi:MAG: BMC domain-containing protein [Clostridia bacterium]|nr:BMC domain-containing protein [Clostridia bacterium]
MAYGFIEVSGVCAAVDALDIMCKTSDVHLVTWERKMGGRLVTLVVEGEVSAVAQSVETAANNCIKKPVAKAVIANPHSEIVKIAKISAARMEKKNAQQKPRAKAAPKAQA